GHGSMARVTGQLEAADITWGNLEETLSTASGSKCGAGSANCFAFQAPPSYAGLLHAAGFDLMNMANNHAFDYGPLGRPQSTRARGRPQTAAAPAKAHVPSTAPPTQITILHRNGTSVAFLGFAPYPWAARLDRIPAAVALVRKAAKEADLVVVAIHAGAEGTD